MLVLKRRKNEQITVGPSTTDTIITVIEIGHGTVHLGLEAPKDVPINRTEVLERQEQANADRNPSDEPWHPRSDDRNPE